MNTSTTYDSNYVVQRIEDGDYERFDIYEGFFPSMPDKSVPIFQSVSGKDKVLPLIKRFQELCPGDFTIFLFPLHKTARASAEKINFFVAQGMIAGRSLHAEVPLNGVPDNSGGNAYQIAMQMFKQMRAEEDVKRLREDLAREREPGDKLANLLTRVANKVLDGSPFAAPINQQPTQQPMNGVDNESIPAATEAQVIQAEKDSIWLIQTFGYGGVQQLVHKLRTDANALAFIKTQI